MESKAQYALVGVVMMALVAMVVGAILWITDTTGVNMYQRYLVYFHSQTLNGLQINSAVTMRGIKIGSVESLGIAPQNIEQVQVLLRLKNGSPIKSDSRAVIERNLLTGLATIDLIGGTQSAPLLVEQPLMDRYPIIPEGRSRIDTVASSIPEVVVNISKISAQLAGFLSPENEQSFRTTLKNAETLSTAFAAERDNIQGLLQDLKALSADLRSASRSISSFTKTGDETLSDLRGSLKSNLDKLGEILGEVDRSASEIANSVSGSSRVMLQQTEAATQSLNQSAKKLAVAAEGMVDLRSNMFGPSANNLGPGEELP